MKPLNYSFSFIQGIWPYNQVRFVVESKLQIKNEKSGLVENYYQCASCKSEDTFAKSDLFYEDNYDFVPVFGPEYGIIYRKKAYLHDNYKSCPLVKDMWDGPRYNLCEAREFELLVSNSQIREHTHKGSLLVAQTELYNAATKLRAIIEYPVKTMNINDEKDYYQVDTGVVLFPDLSQLAERSVDRVSLAFVAFNAPDFADFVLKQPTKVSLAGQASYEIYHYSNPISLPAVNRIFALK